MELLHEKNWRLHGRAKIAAAVLGTVAIAGFLSGKIYSDKQSADQTRYYYQYLCHTEKKDCAMYDQAVRKDREVNREVIVIPLTAVAIGGTIASVLVYGEWSMNRFNRMVQTELPIPKLPDFPTNDGTQEDPNFGDIESNE